ncbi:MAG: antitoxin MazE family protein [Burkholderiaceae bacterium]|nr:antitoxin MazE family protein [Burkholderiaceae bacterium]
MGTPVTARVQKRREALRMAGLRPVQIWVPDTRRPSFAEECHRQSAALINDKHEREILEWAASDADPEGWR